MSESWSCFGSFVEPCNLMWFMWFISMVVMFLLRCRRETQRECFNWDKLHLWQGMLWWDKFVMLFLKSICIGWRLSEYSFNKQKSLFRCYVAIVCVVYSVKQTQQLVRLQIIGMVAIWLQILKVFHVNWNSCRLRRFTSPLKTLHEIISNYV